MTIMNKIHENKTELLFGPGPDPMEFKINKDRSLSPKLDLKTVLGV